MAFACMISLPFAYFFYIFEKFSWNHDVTNILLFYAAVQWMVQFVVRHVARTSVKQGQLNSG